MKSEKGDDEIKANKVEDIQTFLKDAIPDRVVVFVEEFVAKLMSARIAILSFVAGVIITGAAIFVPVYQQVETLTEPVTLFETILGDIKRGYVDEVDTNKLFETGVSAMLRSLDPYTEFEGRQEAEALNESIDGKYGGVGLVISGATPQDIAKIRQEQRQQSSNSSSGSKLLPNDAIQDNLQLRDGDNLSTNSPDEDFDDDEGDSLQDRLERRKALEKVEKQGIRVVSAFEGFAFDYGM
jgi:hypothetical protein